MWRFSAADDPASVADRIAAGIADAAGIDGAAAELANAANHTASDWCGRDANGAAAWAVSLPDGKVREQAIAGVARQWAEFDTVAASEWISQLSAGPDRDMATAPLVHQIASTDPEAALAWASSVTDADQQVNLLTSTLTAWKNFNPAAARNALDQSDLPDEIKARVRQTLE